MVCHMGQFQDYCCLILILMIYSKNLMKVIFLAMLMTQRRILAELTPNSHSRITDYS